MNHFKIVSHQILAIRKKPTKPIPLKMESFTNFQRRMWLTLSKLGVCRFYIDVSSGQYKIKKGRTGVFLFWLFWTNNISKFTYHLLTYHGLLGIKVGFLDQMSIWDWFLMYWHVFMECLVWFFKYPMWENLYRQYELQDSIYKKLGKPKEAAKKITRTDRINSVIYGGVCIIGTIAYAIQFFFTPKYALNTYAIVPADNIYLRIIFCLHECLFMLHGYTYQAFTMVLAESYAVSYQHLLEEMNKALNSLQLNEKRINLDAKAPGTEYDIRTLLLDYKKVMISSQFHNNWIGLVMGFPEGINYGQFVSDVFMLIQLLKEPETDYFGVFFYIMDAAFGMVMIFRMLIILSRLYPQGEQFIHNIRIFTCLNIGKDFRKELSKVVKSMRVVSAKLTGYTVKPGSVPVGVNVLINWYIAAAMYKRPDDPSRRT